MERPPSISPKGANLAFVIGAFRSGTTLLRKVLGAHPEVRAPAESWFMLPLLDVWEGRGEHPDFKPQQAAAALRGMVREEVYRRAARRFASTIYTSCLGPGERLLVDKTPFYLQIASSLPVLFPDARFVVLTRDPRAIAWSRYTWRHSGFKAPRATFRGVSRDMARLAAFKRAFDVHMIRYESLCTSPEPTVSALCASLGLDFDRNMLRYGDAVLDEGYGDESTRDHREPHATSLRRWAFDPDDETMLLEMCADSMATLGMTA